MKFILFVNFGLAINYEKNKFELELKNKTTDQ